MEFTVAGITYKASRSDARAQFRLLRIIEPVLPALSAMGLALNRGTAFAAVAALAESNEADVHAAIQGCLILCQRSDGEAWTSALNGADTLPLHEALTIVAHVVAYNFGPYFEVERPKFRPVSLQTPNFTPVLLPHDMDWLYRPMLRGLCRYESLVDGTLHIEDVAEMNAALDATDENQRRAAKAAEAPRR